MKITQEKLDMRLFDLDKSVLELNQQNFTLKQELIILNNKLDIHRNTPVWCVCRQCQNEKNMLESRKI